MIIIRNKQNETLLAKVSDSPSFEFSYQFVLQITLEKSKVEE